MTRPVRDKFGAAIAKSRPVADYYRDKFGAAIAEGRCAVSRRCDSCGGPGYHDKPTGGAWNRINCTECGGEGSVEDSLFMEMGLDLAYAQRDGKPLATVEAEYEARIANLYGSKK